MHNLKNGFTLAEVLITLLIIGVIASIVIPGLIQDTQNAEFKTAYKKGYADINQATMRLISDNAGSLKSICNSGDNDCLKNQFKPYLNYVKDCNGSVSADNCWYAANKWKYLNGTPDANTGYPSLVLNNGTMLTFEYPDATCNSAIGTSGYTYCGIIYMDINGFKGPATIGKDIYRVWLLEKIIKPTGIQGDVPSLDCSVDGRGCAALYLYQ